MAPPQQRAGDPNAGRLVVIAAAVLGVGGLVGFGVVEFDNRNKAKAKANALQVEVETKADAPSTRDLLTRSHRARLELDTPALAQIDRELATAVTKTTTAPKALETRSERLAVLSTLAIEASVRAKALDQADAQQQAADYAAEGQALADELAGKLDPGAMRATRARFTLASGGDVLARHPSVLLPAFRDRELQHAVLAQALWTPDEASIDDAEILEVAEEPGLVQALEQLRDPSGLERVLLAVALHESGDDTRAQTVLDGILTSVPDQPLASGLRARIRQGGLVAVADPSGLPTNPLEPDPLEPDPTTPDPTTPDPIEPDPVTPDPIEPDPTTPDPIEPDPATPDPIEPDPVKPDPVKPKPKTDKPKTDKPKTDKPKPKPSGSKRKTPAELTTEGCKLVKSGNAQQGFSMLQKAFDHDPRNTKVILCMAEGHMKLGRLPSARAMAERVLAKSPKNKKVLLLAAKIEHKLGNKRAATDYYREVLAIDPENSTAQSYIEKNG